MHSSYESAIMSHGHSPNTPAICAGPAGPAPAAPKPLAAKPDPSHMTNAPQAQKTHDPAFGWDDSYLIGFVRIDEEHREFVELLTAARQCHDDEFTTCLQAFAKHAAAHFAAEDHYMRETEFPPRECHIDEHAAVMQSIHDVSQLVAAGDHAEGRRLVEALIDWFPRHVHHLDSALSHWMSTRSFGGKPVILRRNVAFTA